MISQYLFDKMKPMPPFKKPLRDANRVGRKWQTRRILNPQPITTTGFWNELHWANESHFRKGAIQHCRYGKAGDIRYMREPLVRGADGCAYYKDDDVLARSLLTGEPIAWRWKTDVLSQLYMPKEAARTFKCYEFIRVERVKEITQDDAVAEGCYEAPGKSWGRLGFSILWDEINAERGYSWNENPWVWVIGYRSIDLFGNLVIIDDFLEPLSKTASHLPEATTEAGDESL